MFSECKKKIKIKAWIVCERKKPINMLKNSVCHCVCMKIEIQQQQEEAAI